MSKAACNWVRSVNIDRTAKAVLFVLAIRAGKNHDCWPNHRTIAADCSCSPDTVERALKRLYAAGLVHREMRYDKRGRRTSNLYILAVGANPQVAGVSNPQNAGDGKASLTRKMRGTHPHFAGEHMKSSSEKEKSKTTTVVPTTPREAGTAPDLEKCQPTHIQPAPQEPSQAPHTDFEKCRPVITQLVRALYPNHPYPPRAGIEKFIRAALDGGSPVGDVLEAARILLGKALDDDEITKPSALFMRILGDVRREGKRGKPPIPLGAIDLGNGQYLSRW